MKIWARAVIATGVTTLAIAGLLAPVTANAAASSVPAAAQNKVALASPGDCDGNAVIGRFKRVSSGASFTYNGRSVELQNESVFDLYSRAEIKSGRQSGDQVWVDRSYHRFSLSSKGIVSNATAESEGWKQCGPFSGNRTQSVLNSVYAARACARMDGVSRCGSWYVD